MAQNTYVAQSGTWHRLKHIHAAVAGVWKSVRSGYVASGGSVAAVEFLVGNENGTAGSQVFIDQAGKYTVTAQGGAAPAPGPSWVVGAPAPYLNSIYFSNNGYVTASPIAGGYDFEEGDWTLEGLMYSNSTIAGVFFAKGNLGDTAIPVELYGSYSTGLRFFASLNVFWDVISEMPISPGGAFAAGTWFYWCVQRRGGMFSTFWSPAPYTTATRTDHRGPYYGKLKKNTAPMCIGDLFGDTGANNWEIGGCIGVRLTRGALYGDVTSYPVPAMPFTTTVPPVAVPGTWKKFFQRIAPDGSQSFYYTGGPQYFTVPEGHTGITVSGAAGGGGGSPGMGAGSFVYGSYGGSGGGAGGSTSSQFFNVSSGQQLTINIGYGGVGGIGKNNTTATNPGSPGGATTIPEIGLTLNGGGGAGSSPAYNSPAPVGVGGVPNGGNGTISALTANGNLGVAGYGGANQFSGSAAGGANGGSSGAGGPGAAGTANTGGGGGGGGNSPAVGAYGGNGGAGGYGFITISWTGTPAAAGSATFYGSSATSYFNVPQGKTSITVTAQAAGGGGAGGAGPSTTGTSGGGGGSGGFQAATAYAVTPGQQLAINVGLGGYGGGAAGPGGCGAAGQAGGVTSIAALGISLGGGLGAQGACTANPGGGGSPNGLTGNAGGGSAPGGAGANSPYGGVGGAGGADGGGSDSGGAGQPGQAHTGAGGGGGGAAHRTDQSRDSGSGGAGAGGIVIISWA